MQVGEVDKLEQEQDTRVVSCRVSRADYAALRAVARANIRTPGQELRRLILLSIRGRLVEVPAGQAPAEGVRDARP